MKRKNVTEILRDCYWCWGRKGKAYLLELPTGAGKTWFSVFALQAECIRTGTTMAIICNRKILKKQIMNMVKIYEVEHRLKRHVVQVFTYQEIEQDSIKACKKLKYMENCRFVVVDEAHYWVNDPRFNPAADISLKRIMSLYSKTCLIFMTATADGFKKVLDQYIDRSNNKKLKKRKNYNSLSQMVEDENSGFEPGDFCYENISGEFDYSYLDLKFFHERGITDLIVDFILQAPKQEKWIVFVQSKKKGKELEKNLNIEFEKERGKRLARFIRSGYEDDPQMRSIVEGIVKNECFECNVLITTSVMDNGVTISDKRVKNIVMLGAFSETEFKQMIGRVRVGEEDKLNLYVDKCDAGYFSRMLNKLHQRLDYVIKLWMCTGNYEEAIWDCQMPWEIVNCFLYKRGGRIRMSESSFYLFSEDYRAVRSMYHKMKEDSSAYAREVCSWLGKNMTADLFIGAVTEEDLAIKINDELNGRMFMKKEEYDNMARKVTELLGRNASTRMDTVNSVLDEYDNIQHRMVTSFSLKKQTYYLLYEKGRFPYELKGEVEKPEYISGILKESQIDIKEIFLRLFGKEMPDIFIDEKVEVEFLNECMSKQTIFGWRGSFRRGQNGLQYIPDKAIK